MWLCFYLIEIKLTMVEKKKDIWVKKVYLQIWQYAYGEYNNSSLVVSYICLNYIFNALSNALVTICWFNYMYTF